MLKSLIIEDELYIRKGLIERGLDSCQGHYTHPVFPFGVCIERIGHEDGGTTKKWRNYDTGNNAPDARGRTSLWSSDQALESKNETVYLRSP